MVYFGLDPGKFVRYLVGKYTGQNCNVQRTLDAVQDHVTPEDYEHMNWILLHGCPAQLTIEEPSSNKLEFIAQGNSKTFINNPQLVRKTHLVPMDQLFV